MSKSDTIKGYKAQIRKFSPYTRHVPHVFPALRFGGKNEVHLIAIHEIN